MRCLLIKYCFSFIILLLSISLPTISKGQEAFLLTDSTRVYALDRFSEIFIDSTNSLSFEKILQPANQQKFRKTNKKGISLGYNPYTIWAKVHLKNTLPTTQWILEIPLALIDTVGFYQKNHQDWQTILCGYHLPHHTRLSRHTGFSFPLYFQTGEDTFYVRISGTSPKLLPLRVLAKEVFHEKVRHEDVGYGILFGIFIIMFCYNLMIYFALRDINYLLYVTTLIFTASFIVTVSGYGQKYLWANYPIMNFYGARIALGCLGIAVAVFSNSFLEARKYSTIAHYGLMSILPLSILSIILAATNIMPSAPNNLISICAPLFLTSGIICWVKGNPVARFYVTAWSFYIVGGLVTTLRNSGLWEFNFWTTHMVEIGAAMETFLLAFALSDKYRKYKQEKETNMIKAQAELEMKVRERTQEIQERSEELLALNEEIRQQTEEILAQRDALEMANDHITTQNEDIIASVLYAKRIQDALMPKRDKLERFFDDFLLLHKPKDIVNGDFYWFATVDSWKNAFTNHDGFGLSMADVEYKPHKIAFLAIADCTGHGVPGAFMTVIGGGLLDQIINRDKIYSPASILAELDRRLLRTLQQQAVEKDHVQDGMDISLLQIDLVGKVLVWASAKRPLWIIEHDKDEITTYKGDKYPIGSSQFKEKTFTEKEIQLQTNDIIYTFTDGYADQFGEAGKMTVRRFKEFLLKNRHNSFVQQDVALRTYLTDWQGEEAQTDDILVAGLRIV